jgi:hypothetical protein
MRDGIDGFMMAFNTLRRHGRFIGNADAMSETTRRLRIAAARIFEDPEACIELGRRAFTSLDLKDGSATEAQVRAYYHSTNDLHGSGMLVLKQVLNAFDAFEASLAIADDLNSSCCA